MEITRETTSLPEQVKQIPLPRKIGLRRQTKDALVRQSMGAITISVCAFILTIAVVLFYRSWPLLSTYSLAELLTSQDWHPMRGQFGFAPFIIGSLAVTLVAVLFSVIPAILSGIYLAEYTSSRFRGVLKPLLDLLVGIPSVVYGLWGVLFIVPLVRDTIGPWSERTLGKFIPWFSRSNPSGYGLLAAGFVLGVMVFPLVVAVSEEVMRAAPRETREAALCLGATRWEATKLIVRRQALGGLLAAAVLGLLRAFGETLAVMMLIGNTVKIPTSLFDTAYSLPALIANNYGEMMSVPLYESALMGAALLLLVVVVGFNTLARLVIVRVQRTAAI
jgi:phosphate transport system permease protein